jgi:hypothetical protein
MEAIPVFHCLYHDYALSYGTVHQLGGEHPGAYTYGEALILNSGQALMVENYYKEDIGTDRFSRELEYLRRLCQARKRAHKWLTFGRWLPPVDLATDIVRVTFGPSPEDTMRVPAVLTSSWGLEDGSVCILLINHTGHPRRASYTIPTETYGLAAESVEVAELGEDGEKPVDCADGHSALDRVDVVPRWSVRVLVLRPAGRR